MPTDATRKKPDMSARFRECRIEPCLQAEGPLLRNQCEQLREEDTVRSRQEPADASPERERHVEQSVARKKVKQTSMPAGRQFSTRLVQHGTILDAGRTGALATTA